MKVNIGKGLEFDVDTSRLNAAVLEHVQYIGLRNILMDSHANHTKDADGDDYVELSRLTAEKKLDSMYNGEVRTASTREGDPVEAEAVRIALGKIKEAIRKAGKKVSDYDTKLLREKAKALLEKNAWMRTEARKRVDEAKATEVEGIEL